MFMLAKLCIVSMFLFVIFNFGIWWLHDLPPDRSFFGICYGFTCVITWSILLANICEDNKESTHVSKEKFYVLHATPTVTFTVTTYHIMFIYLHSILEVLTEIVLWWITRRIQYRILMTWMTIISILNV